MSVTKHKPKKQNTQAYHHIQGDCHFTIDPQWWATYDVQRRSNDHKP
ncbi:MAG: hypothetical protein RIG77_01240 [Cyclobacteriaceae bacterium]